MKNLVTTLVLFSVYTAAQTPSSVAIRNAKIVTISGPVINKGTVVVHHKLIEAVGENVPIPAYALVIEGEGLTIYPGLVDGLSTWGLPGAAPPPATTGRAGGRGATPAPATPAAPVAPAARGPEDRPSTTSWLKAADEIQPADRRLEAARNAGFTTAVVFPTRGIFAGQGAVIDLAGEKPGEMVVAPTVGQYISLSRGPGMGGGFPSALMGAIAYIRQIYLDADHYVALKQAYEKDPRGMQRPEYDRALEGVLESKRILLPANRVVEMDRMLRFAAELKQPVVLYGMREGYDPRAGDLLKKANAPALISLKWPEKGRDTDPDEVETYRTLESRDKGPSAPAVLKKAGVRFAFYSDGLEQPRDLQRAVKKAIDAGLSREDAVRALTLSPAEIYGVADRIGSIEKGKIANLVVTRGEIFDDRTKVEMIFIDGKKHTPTPEPPGPAGPRPATDPGDKR